MTNSVWRNRYAAAIARFEAMSDEELREARDDEAMDTATLEAFNDFISGEGIDLDDDDDNAPSPVGHGSTPEEALADLRRKVAELAAEDFPGLYGASERKES